MSDPLLRLPNPQPVARSFALPVPVGRQLVSAGLISQSVLLEALALQRRLEAPLGEILINEGHVAPSDVLDALARQYNADRVDLKINPPSPQMAQAIPARLCQTFGVVPWRWVGDTLLVATSRPDKLAALSRDLGHPPGVILPVIAPIDQIHDAITALFGKELAERAVTRVPSALSCRTWQSRSVRFQRVRNCAIVALIVCCVLAPGPVSLAFFAWAFFSLFLTSGLKFLVLMARALHRLPAQSETLPKPTSDRWPRVSVMVPLFKEHRIAEALIARLSRLSYPKALLDVVLVLEAKDTVTRATLSRTKLPCWMRVIEVPDDGTITTKPRALNYALDFCQGDIIGVWDAEDAPEPDQIEKVVASFQTADPDVACLQGMLDFYNARENWLSRCFTIEYASWWRVVLPGVARLGLVLPLGGTTLFFRRDVLEKLGGWDAHNVTEDADLGLRLARRGYRTELIATVTTEEANCRGWPWIKQRSRWLKGFLVTYLVHMRNPLNLYRDLGFAKFLGVQTMFLATVSQFAAIPALLSLWLPLLGIPHPVTDILSMQALVTVITLLLFSEVLNLTIGMIGVSGPRHKHLMPWVFTMGLYFSLGALASYKAIYELIRDPFYWDKTQHGVSKVSDPMPRRGVFRRLVSGAS